MNRRSATILAFLVASAIPALLLVTYFFTKGESHHSVALSEMLASFAAFYMYSTLSAIVLGVPLFLVAARFSLVTWWSALAAGVLVGAVVSGIFRLGNESYVDAFSRYVPAATIAAFVFWLIWRQGRESIST